MHAVISTVGLYRGNHHCARDDYIMSDLQYFVSGPNSSIVSATRYGLDGPGFETPWRRNLAHPSRPALGPIQRPVQRFPGLFTGVNRPGRGVDHPHHLAPRLNTRDMSLFNLWAFLASFRVTFTFTFLHSLE